MSSRHSANQNNIKIDTKSENDASKHQLNAPPKNNRRIQARSQNLRKIPKIDVANRVKDEMNRERKSRNNLRPGEGFAKMGRNIEDKIVERLSALSGPTFDVCANDISEKKFSGRSRLFIGNLPADTKDEEVKELFKPYGEVGEAFVNKDKCFGFIRLDYHANAEKAKCELDAYNWKGRQLKVRFAPNSAVIKVKNLTAFVSNELLHLAFSVFGEIERCVVISDDHGKSTGEGLVEFVRKPSALLAIKYCSDGCFFLTSSLRPVIVEHYEQVDIIDGYPEKALMKKSTDYHRAREVGPRFATPGSFEHEFGTRWKQLHELFHQKSLSLKQELRMEEDKLEAQMQFAKFENETEMLREQLRSRELDRDRQKRKWEERARLADEQRVRNEEQMRRKEEEMQRRMYCQEEDLRRRQQENTLFIQAHKLTDVLAQSEQVVFQSYRSPTDNQFSDFDQQSNSSNCFQDERNCAHWSNANPNKRHHY